jgi:hypothetical protein
MVKRTPREKKRLSLEKDRRNTFGESPHGARKAIPLQKRLRSRIERHSANVPVTKLGDDAVAFDAAVARAVRKRRTSWKKYPDSSLGNVIERKTLRREHLMKSPRKKASIDRKRKREDRSDDSES